MAEEQVETGLRADLDAIKRMIPHRDPFLLIDSVENIHRYESAIGVKQVRDDEPFFEGHFPGEPIMPGVLIIEAMAQTAGVLVVDSTEQADSNLLVYFMGIDKARFRKRVLPGDRLELHVRILRGRGKVWKFYGAAKVGEDLVAEAEYSAMIITADDPRRGREG